MKSTIYILNYSNEIDLICINSIKKPLYKILSTNNTIDGNSNKELIEFKANGLQIKTFLNELYVAQYYRKRLIYNIKLLNLFLIIKLVPVQKEVIDYSWNYQISKLVWEHVELDNTMSWLSTLGGAFSSLGDDYIHFADIAGRISMHQLKLALRLGDPITVSRCRLYFTIALIQNNRLKEAKNILMREYEFAKTQIEIDRRLVRMSLGIWQKLKYAYQMRKEYGKDYIHNNNNRLVKFVKK